MPQVDNVGEKNEKKKKDLNQQLKETCFGGEVATREDVDDDDDFALINASSVAKSTMRSMQWRCFL